MLARSVSHCPDLLPRLSPLISYPSHHLVLPNPAFHTATLRVGWFCFFQSNWLRVTNRESGRMKINDAAFARVAPHSKEEAAYAQVQHASVPVVFAALTLMAVNVFGAHA